MDEHSMHKVSPFVSWLFIFPLACLASEKAVNDPFSPTVIEECLGDQRPLAQDLRQWRLLGSLGHQNHLRSWVFDSEQRPLSLKEGDRLPKLKLMVMSINMGFTDFQTTEALPVNCQPFMAAQREPIRLGFLE